MNIKSCEECGLVYDLDFVNVPSEERVDLAMESGNTEGICQWDGDGFVPVFRCHCGEYIKVL